MPSDLTEDQKQTATKCSPKHTFLVVDEEGEPVLDGATKEDAETACAEGEVVVGYYRKDLVDDLFTACLYYMSEDKRAAMMARFNELKMDEAEAEGAVAETA
jgi:hypothetical protein